MATKQLTPPLKWHGGKHDLAKWIIGLMPPRCQNPNKPDPTDAGWLHYVEPYFGGGSVLLRLNPEGISEVANDLNANLVNFWSVLAGEGTFPRFVNKAMATPFSELLWHQVDFRRKIEHRTVDDAVDFFVHCRQSMSGRMKDFAAITKNRTRRGMNEQVSAWLNCIEGLPAVYERLKRVLILNQDALGVIRKQDGPRTLFYLDPPYLHETRATTGEYQHEMTEFDHSCLLNALISTKHSGGALEGRFLLSGYRSELYDSYAKRFGWTRHEMKINNHAAGGKTKRIMTECVWTNF